MTQKKRAGRMAAAGQTKPHLDAQQCAVQQKVAALVKHGVGLGRLCAAGQGRAWQLRLSAGDTRPRERLCQQPILPLQQDRQKHPSRASNRQSGSRAAMRTRVRCQLLLNRHPPPIVNRV